MQRSEVKGEPKNLEEQAIKLVGRDIYEKLVKGYTEKQWGRKCQDLPPFLIKRLPRKEPYYPINDSKNQSIYARYKERAKGERQVMFGGRLAEYRYYGMDKVIKSAMDIAKAMQ